MALLIPAMPFVRCFNPVRDNDLGFTQDSNLTLLFGSLFPLQKPMRILIKSTSGCLAVLEIFINCKPYLESNNMLEIFRGVVHCNVSVSSRGKPLTTYVRQWTCVYLFICPYVPFIPLRCISSAQSEFKTCRVSEYSYLHLNINYVQIYSYVITPATIWMDLHNNGWWLQLSYRTESGSEMRDHIYECASET